MARQKRIDKRGLYYISNRSVELRKAFVVKEDYSTFIDTLCLLSDTHEFSIHSYMLLPYGYYLLIETKENNLSGIMRVLNSTYSRYFNKKYGRNGSLWEGRYKSTFMEDVSYAFYFIRYMENLPKLAGITSELRSYHYSTYRQFIGLDECLTCIESSIIFKRFNTIEEIKVFFTSMLKKEFIDNIIEILRQQNLDKGIAECVSKELNLESYFFLNQSKDEININIVRALKDGASQTKVGNFLGISQQAVCLKIKKYKLKNREEK
ncbi:MAG TPA: hypothetical protein EYG94_09120 [Campylobacterales bacterium]|nr:hypothetical protein [Campylobacterales bacterium]